MRPDRVMYSLDIFINSVFGENFDWRFPFPFTPYMIVENVIDRDLSKVDLKQIVEIDSKALSPLMLCSEAGQGLY